MDLGFECFSCSLSCSDRTGRCSELAACRACWLPTCATARHAPARRPQAGSTRLLVTHQRQFLPRCDRIAVLRDGRLHALGSWQEVAALQLPELVAGNDGVDLGPGANQQDAEEASPGEDPAATSPLPKQAESCGQQQDQAQPECDQSAHTNEQQQHSAQAAPAGPWQEEEEPDQAAGPMLSRVRTMAPDVNRRLVGDRSGETPPPPPPPHSRAGAGQCLDADSATDGLLP